MAHSAFHEKTQTLRRNLRFSVNHVVYRSIPDTETVFLRRQQQAPPPPESDLLGVRRGFKLKGTLGMDRNEAFGANTFLHMC